MTTVTLYSKPACHLCDEVRAILHDLAEEGRFALQEIDIETDRELFERYRFEIPIVTMDGKEIARGRISERDLLIALAVRY